MPKKIEILITIQIADDLIEKLQKVSDSFSITHIPTRQPDEIPPEVWGKTEVLFTLRTFPEPEQAPNLRWVQLYFAGADKMLKAPIFENPDVQLTSLSGANAPQVSEHILALILALSRHLPELARQQSRNNWPTERNKRFIPQELNASTVGIVGYGSIGRQTAQLLHTFGAEILASKVNLKLLEDHGFALENTGDPQGILPKRLYPAEALRSMFKECDFVVVTAPLTDKTRAMIAKPQLAAMKPSAFLIDVSRGGIVDHDALIQVLQSKKIAGAALDVFPNEPLASDSPLWEMGNVIITPHIAGLSVHYEERAMLLFTHNLERYLEDQALLNIVDTEKGY